MRISIAWTADHDAFGWWGLGFERYCTKEQRGIRFQFFPWTINIKLWHPTNIGRSIWEGYKKRKK